MTIPLRLTPFGLEQRGVYVQQDRHDEYYEQLLSPSHCSSTRQDCCCISILLLGDQNAGKSALLYSLVATKDPKYTALTSLLPIIQGEFSNRREVLPDAGVAAVLATADGGTGPTARVELGPDCAAAGVTDKDTREELHHMVTEYTETDKVTSGTATAAAAVEALEALVRRSRDEFPFLDSDVARSAALLSAEDFAFFCSEFGIQSQQEQQKEQQQQHHDLWTKVNDSRYVLLHLLEFGGDHLDRMHAFYTQDCSHRDGSDSSTIGSTCCGKCAFSSNCSKCDEAAAAALLHLELERGNQGTPFRTLYKPEKEIYGKGAVESGRPADQAPVTQAPRAGEPRVSAARASILAQSLRRSFKLAAEVPLLVYFVNCSTIFVPVATHDVASAAAVPISIALSAPAFYSLLLRLHACCSFLQPTENRRRPIHFACSRLSCQSVISDAADEGENNASARAAAASATGCCCRGFNERESFRTAVEVLKAFVSIASSCSAADAGASKAAAGAAAVPVEKSIASARAFLDQPFESLYRCFISDIDASNDSSIPQNRASNTPTEISWTPFEDCWGVSACAPLKAEDDKLQQCTSVVFLNRLLGFVWRVCSPLPFCRCLNFRGVSAVRVLERSSNWGQKQHSPPPQQQQHDAWGPRWQLCVVSVIAFLARALALLAEAEKLGEANTDAAVGSGAGTKVHEHPTINKRTLPGVDSGSAQSAFSDSRKFEEGEGEPANWQQLQLVQQHGIMTGETGRQLVSLFAACAHSHRQQEQQQAPPKEVYIDLWVSYTDWRDFISDFDPMEQQLQQQQISQDQHTQQKQITLPATGETVIASAVEGDSLLLLPAAAAAAAFSPLASELISLGCCLPCCIDGGPWPPLAVQFSINLPGTGNHRTPLLLLPEVLEGPLRAVQQQLHKVHYPPMSLNQKELLRGDLLSCLAAVRLPFHPAVCGLFDSILSSCTREPLPADFWTSGAAATVAAAIGSANVASVLGGEEADAEYGRLSKLAVVGDTVRAAVDAAARNAQALLQQRLQQESLHTEQAKDNEIGNEALINSLQLLLHLAGDLMLLQQMATATQAKGSQLQERRQQKRGEKRTTCEWNYRTGGPYCLQNQLFWTVNLQSPATETTEACAGEAGNSAPAVNECCTEQTGNEEMLKCALLSTNRELRDFGLVLLPALQAGQLLLLL